VTLLLWGRLALLAALAALVVLYYWAGMARHE
jgi:hypothetical protein